MSFGLFEVKVSTVFLDVGFLEASYRVKDIDFAR